MSSILICYIVLFLLCLINAPAVCAADLDLTPPPAALHMDLTVRTLVPDRKEFEFKVLEPRPDVSGVNMETFLPHQSGMANYGYDGLLRPGILVAFDKRGKIVYFHPFSFPKSVTFENGHEEINLDTRPRTGTQGHMMPVHLVQVPSKWDGDTLKITDSTGTSYDLLKWPQSDTEYQVHLDKVLPVLNLNADSLSSMFDSFSHGFGDGMGLLALHYPIATVGNNLVRKPVLTVTQRKDILQFLAAASSYEKDISSLAAAEGINRAGDNADKIAARLALRDKALVKCVQIFFSACDEDLEDCYIGTSSGTDITPSPTKPFDFIVMSGYELWTSDQIKAMKAPRTDPTRRKYVNYLNLMLFERMYRHISEHRMTFEDYEPAICIPTVMEQLVLNPLLPSEYAAR